MRRVVLLAVASGVALVACDDGPRRPRSDAAPPARITRGEARAEPVGPAPYPASVRSLRLKRSIVVRLAPDENGKPIGTVAQDTRVRWTSVAAGPGCERWVEIDPRGWVCDRYLEATEKDPVGVELPRLKPDELVPGVYAKVVAGGADAYKSVADIEKKKPARRLPAAVKVRHVDEDVVGGKLYWKTTQGEWIEYAKLSKLTPSGFVGVSLEHEGAPALPMAWAQSRGDLGRPVPVRNAPGGAVVRSLAPRTVVSLVETSGDGKWHRTDRGWIAAADLHEVRRTAPPPLTGEHERWFDVDLDEQVVVAYEGEDPVYATLTSSGSKKWPTKTGIYRIWLKFAETDMNGQMGDEDPYSVATVPWTMFFAKDLAFHTAYWHDKFGDARSHGCLNLAPRDARALYQWASPDVPLGWSMVYGVVEKPGSMVRIRSAADPEPVFVGYAKRVHEARLAKAPPPAPVAPVAPVEAASAPPAAVPPAPSAGARPSPALPASAPSAASPPAPSAGARPSPSSASSGPSPSAGASPAPAPPSAPPPSTPASASAAPPSATATP